MMVLEKNFFFFTNAEIISMKQDDIIFYRAWVMVLTALFSLHPLKLCAKFSLNLPSRFREGDGNLEKLTTVSTPMTDTGHFFSENLILLLAELWYTLTN